MNKQGILTFLLTNIYRTELQNQEHLFVQIVRSLPTLTIP